MGVMDRGPQTFDHTIHVSCAKVYTLCQYLTPLVDLTHCKHSQLSMFLFFMFKIYLHNLNDVQVSGQKASASKI